MESLNCILSIINNNVILLFICLHGNARSGVSGGKRKRSRDGGSEEVAGDDDESMHHHVSAMEITDSHVIRGSRRSPHPLGYL